MSLLELRGMTDFQSVVAGSKKRTGSPFYQFAKPRYSPGIYSVQAWLPNRETTISFWYGAVYSMSALELSSTTNFQSVDAGNKKRTGSPFDQFVATPDRSPVEEFAG